MNITVEIYEIKTDTNTEETNPNTRQTTKTSKNLEH